MCSVDENNEFNEKNKIIFTCIKQLKRKQTLINFESALVIYFQPKINKNILSTWVYKHGFIERETENYKNFRELNLRGARR